MNARLIPCVGLGGSLALHALVLTLVSGGWVVGTAPPADEPSVLQMTLVPPAPVPPPPPPPERVRPPVPRVRPVAAAPIAPAVPEPARVPTPTDDDTPLPPACAASMAAPPAPTAEEWAFASRYTLKNSKGYRHTWGQQVRSMMGTAVEGPDQGAVRFRVEISAEGRLTRLETIWSTSPVAERLARQAITSLPGWPPTPTGQPLVFEKTISFTPYATDGPPLYKDDCLPDRPAFGNPYAWDGHSDRPPTPAQAQPTEQPDPQALEECLKQLPRDSIEAESARDRRLMERWSWGASKPGR